MALADPFWSAMTWSAATVPSGKAHFYCVSSITHGARGKTCRAEAAPPGNFNRSLTTFAYLGRTEQSWDA
jgi:hypothetical protein